MLLVLTAIFKTMPHPSQPTRRHNTETDETTWDDPTGAGEEAAAETAGTIAIAAPGAREQGI